MDDSWIKLYRKIMKSPIWKNEKALKIWVWCLLKASHVPREQLVGLQIVNLKKGEFIFGRKTAADELGLNETTVYKYIKMIQKLRNVGHKK